MIGWQWNQLNHMQIICTSLQTDNHASNSSLNFFTDKMLFQMPNQSTEGNLVLREDQCEIFEWQSALLKPNGNQLLHIILSLSREWLLREQMLISF